MIKAVLCDSDGTLVDTNKLIIETFKYTLKKHCGIDVEDSDIVRCFGEPLGVTMARYDRNNVDCLVNAYREYNEKYHDEMISKIEGVVEGLDALKKMGIKTAVVTSKGRSLVEKELKMFGVYEYMDAVVTMEDTEIHKPEGEPALKACELLNVMPENALMIGDSHNDILCGKNAGCLTCLVNYTALPIENILVYKPDYTIDNFIELADIIKKLL